MSRVGGRSGERFISPVVQEERIRAYASAHGLEIGTVYREFDRSGSDGARPVFRQIIARAADGISGGIVVARLDRFARSALDALRALREIEQTGGVFISVDEGLDSSTPFGHAIMTILLALAELELGRLRENWDTAQRQAIARGVHTSSRVPVGYRRGASGRLVPGEAAAIVAEAFRRRAEGATYKDIAAFFTSEGLVSSGGRSHWAAHTIESVMKNRVYTGEARRGSHHNPTAHPAIVPMHLWLAAQFGADARIAHPSARTLLAGLIRCGGCCHVLAASWMLLAGGRPGRQVNGYRCRGHFKRGHCPSPAWVLARDIEQLVVEDFFGRLRSLRRRPIDFAPLEAELVQTETEYARRSDEQRLSPETNPSTLAWAAQKMEEKQRELLNLVRRDALFQLPATAAMRRAWPTMPLNAQRRALGLAFDAIVVERGDRDALQSRVHVIGAGQMPDYFPTSGRESTLQPYVAAH